MSKIFLARLFATFLCASLAAQAPQTPSPSSPRVAPPAAGADTQLRSTERREIRREGRHDHCGGLHSASAPGSGTAGAAGTSGSAPNAFILASAMKPAGTTAATPDRVQLSARRCRQQTHSARRSQGRNLGHVAASSGAAASSSAHRRH